MVSFEELRDIIINNNGSATLDKIVETYGINHHMIMFPEHKINIKNKLKSSKSFRFNIDKKWEYLEENDIYLFVEDKKSFSKEVDVLNEIFGCNYQGFQRGGLNIKDRNCLVWFPKIDNKSKSGWLNIYDKNSRILTETRTDGKANCGVPENPDLIRYVFPQKNGKYEFLGAFKYEGIINNNTRKYSLVDEKVEIATIKNKQIRMIFCNIGYWEYYNGKDNFLGGGGAYTQENGDGGEKYNFFDQGGKVYGFVETGNTLKNTGDLSKTNQIHLEFIDPKYKKADEIDNVRVVFISRYKQKIVVVGWYDNAIVYRKRHINNVNPFGYNFICKKEDAHLIPMKNRDKEYVRKNDDGTYNHGESNISYPFYYKKTNKIRGADTDTTMKKANEINEYIDKLLNDQTIVTRI